ncbi:SMI1/KNR4 family protein [Paenibacillus harenae]|uniref:Knr4/Smi1-like domain-containing protein n=1 Tax=Paenibacillus harenae TaxID=306543 RepID=A0ABT9U289_PAEHA|nr:SMI1/KNR4 family protein [Paenibacillus harenae]MDQ0112434.1 hypothetical protein [Paenibacillus harenae]
MKQGELIKKTIVSLKDRLEKNNGLLELQLGEGYLTQAICTFNEPVSESELLHFQKEAGLKLPVDYYNFLLLTNGCSLFDHPQYGGEAQICKWQDTEVETIEDLHEGYMKLKIARIYQDDIIIDLKAYNEGSNNYMMVKGSMISFTRQDV